MTLRIQNNDFKNKFYLKSDAEKRRGDARRPFVRAFEVKFGGGVQLKDSDHFARRFTRTFARGGSLEVGGL